MTTRIVCHRGACRVAPENTVASAVAASRLGGDIVELDLRQSRDGVLYLMHDATLERTTDGAGAIAETDAREIDRLDAGSWFDARFAGEPVPRLERFFAAVMDRLDFYIEVKACDPGRLGAAIRKAGLEARCLTLSEDPAIRAALRDELPWLRAIINFNDVGEIAEARAQGFSIIEFDAADVTEARLCAARGLGLEIMIYTPELDRAAFETAFAHEAHYLNVDFPGIASRMRSERR